MVFGQSVVEADESEKVPTPVNTVPLEVLNKTIPRHPGAE